ncbi:MAG TPA: GPW/gp25 family protein [Fibrobacteria bacterium]|nr:GPW/gp25 family protein [Fibrobacteria bacterium]
MSGRHLAFPFRIGADGRTAAPADVVGHVKGELIQLLLTDPGERPFLPEFGGGVRRMVFEKNGDVAAGILKARLSQALARWLGKRVAVEKLLVEASDATLSVDLQYRVLPDGESRRMRFERQENG